MYRHKSKATCENSGFTLIEMLIIAPILILMIGVFISTMVSLTGEVLSAEKANRLSFNIQDALNRIEQDVKLSKSFLATNSISLTQPQGYNDITETFTNVGTNGTMLILNTYTTTINPQNPTYDLVYLPNQIYSCDNPLVSRNKPLMMNTVYFVKGNTLWRRVIANTDYESAGCDVPWQQPSCTTDQIGGVCKTEDTELINNIQTTGFNVNYYTSADSTTAVSDPSNQTTLDTCNTIGVTISATSTAAGQEITRTGTIRATIELQ